MTSQPSGFKFRFAHKGIVLVAVPLICELLFVGLLTHRLGEAERAADTARHAERVQIQTMDLTATMMASTTELVRWKFTGNQRSLERYEEMLQMMNRIVARLKEEAKSYPAESAQIDKMIVRLDQLQHTLKNDIGRSNWRSLMKSETPQVQKQIEAFKQEIRELRQIEQAVEESSPEKERRTRENLRTILLGGVILNIILAIGVSLYFSRSVRSRIVILMDNARRLVKHQPLRQPVGGTDELADLESIFHDMANCLLGAQQRKQEFYAMVSHDVRTPLMSLHGTLDLLMSGAYGALNARGEKRVSQAQGTLDQLICLVNNLLDLERAENGVLTIQKKICRLDAIVDRAVSSLASLAERRHITIIRNDEPIEVEADQQRMTQVVINLLSNAIKYSGERTSIAISTKTIDGSQIEVSVRDEGPGIPPEKLSMIFERFAQVGTEIDQSNASSGLGLTICKSIVEAHGGSIVATNAEEGTGAVFSFTLTGQPVCVQQPL